MVLSFVLVTTSSQMLYGYQTAPSPPPADSGNPTDPAPQSAAEFQALVAPIALYPDALVAQFLPPRRFPTRWRSRTTGCTNTRTSRETLDAGSRQAILGFEREGAHRISVGPRQYGEESDLDLFAGRGIPQPAIGCDVGYSALARQSQSGRQSQVDAPDYGRSTVADTIVIQPTNPQVVYVPEYNPAVIYGTPYVIPGYRAGDVAAAGILGFGAGIAVGAMLSGCGWGYRSWNCGWHGTAVVYHGGAFYGNSAWHGGYYNGGYHGGYGYNNAYNHTNITTTSPNHKRIQQVTTEQRQQRQQGRKPVNVNTGGSEHEREPPPDSWAHHDSAFGKSNAFSGMGDHSGGFGGSGVVLEGRQLSGLGQHALQWIRRRPVRRRGIWWRWLRAVAVGSGARRCRTP